MQAAPIPISEKSRIATLRLLNILDTEPEERFDRLTRMAKKLFSVPIAQVTLVDSERQWFKSSVGVEALETPRDVSFCAHAILGEGIMLVPDARDDERFSDNPLVLGDPNIRFYAGCPLKVGKENLGTLCLIDDRPREFGEEEQQLLRDLAEMAERELNAVQMATTDHLTGISNRRGFEVLARHALQVCRRLQLPVTLLSFDLNQFKAINDRHGHAAGDMALKTFAQGLMAIFRESDVIGRLGGDEFAVLMTGVKGDFQESCFLRLREWLRVNNRVELTGYEILFSVGMIEVAPQERMSIEGLMARADSAMYEHKKGSRTRS